MKLRDELLDLSIDFEECALAITDDKRRQEYWPKIDRLRELARSIAPQVPSPKYEAQIEEESYYPI